MVGRTPVLPQGLLCPPGQQQMRGTSCLKGVAVITHRSLQLTSYQVLDNAWRWVWGSARPGLAVPVLSCSKHTVLTFIIGPALKNATILKGRPCRRHPPVSTFLPFFGGSPDEIRISG